MIRTNLLIIAIAIVAGQHGQPRVKLTYTDPVSEEIIVQVQLGTNTWKDWTLSIALPGTNVVSFDQPTNAAEFYRLRTR